VVIHILDKVALDTKTIIAMPCELVLRDVPDSVFKTRGDRLAHEFLEGVQFMHQHIVAHLDLKPDNILVRTTRPQRLLIIDFGVSVQVSGPESLFTGYRGTEGWAAPELEENTGKECRPIRADLWSAGRVLKYFAWRQRADANCQFKYLADQLLHRDPLQRPLLGKTVLVDCSCEKDPQTVKLKKKLDVDALEKKGGKRKCVQPRPQIVPQDAPDIPASFRSTSGRHKQMGNPK
jgi:serine/threonine protein kinase